MTLPKPNSGWRAAGKIETDCRVFANNRQRRRAAKRRMRVRNIRETLGHPINQKEHHQDKILVKRLNVEIGRALYRIHVALVKEFKPRDEFPITPSEEFVDEQERSAAY